MAVVRCVMMQRDESLLLEAWFRYYGYLFGFENLVVFDNGSTETDVLATLDRFERAGCQILRGHDRIEDFHAKGSHFRNLITHWDAQSSYDFALPVDADEFLALFTPDGLTSRRNAIHAYLDGLIGTQQALALQLSLFNAPGKPGCFAVEEYRKSFLPARSIEGLDHGFHAARSRLAQGSRLTDLAYLHLHNKPFPTLLRQARRKLERFVDVEDRETLRSYTGPGLHLVQYFFMTEADYVARHDVRPLLRFPYFSRLMAALGITGGLFGDSPDDPEWCIGPDAVGFVPPGGVVQDAMPFSPRAYRDAYPDVRDAGWNPIHHYVAHGCREGRSAPQPAS